MKRILYALLLRDSEEASMVVAEVTRLVDEAIIENAEVALKSDGAVIVRRGDSRCLVSASAGVLHYGASVRLATFGESPPDVGFCWEILLGLHIDWPRDVWLSTFSRSDLERKGGNNVLPLSIEGQNGYIVSSQRFAELFP